MSELIAETFGENYIIKNLPDIKTEDIRPNASVAEFICYCASQNVAIQDIASRCDFSPSEVKQIIEEVKEAEIFEDLARTFVKKKT